MWRWCFDFLRPVIKECRWNCYEIFIFKGLSINKYWCNYFDYLVSQFIESDEDQGSQLEFVTPTATGNYKILATNYSNLLLIEYLYVKK